MTRAGRGHRSLGMAALAGAIMLVAAGCGGEGGGGGGEGGTVIAGIRTDFSGLNPVTNTSQYTDEVIKYGLYTPLVQYDESLEVQPYLAESWEMEGDTAVVFTLRQDVTWHDGEPVTAEDVKFTFDLAKDSATASLIGSVYLDEVETAEVIDPHTIRFGFTRPHAQALEDFWWAPLPKHLLEDTAPSELMNAPFNRQPVGSGPYRFGEWLSNQRLVLDPNPDFPEGLGGPPQNRRVVFRIIPEPATLLTELRTGGVHIDIDVQPDQAQQVEQGGQMELHSFPGRTFYYLGWNNAREPFTDPRVRRAMTHALDREEIVQALLSGYGEVASGPVPSWSPLYPEGVQPLSHDPQQAQQLLEAAGWTDSNGDGVLDKDGRPFEFTLLTSDRPLNRSVAEVVQEQLRGVGVAAEIRVLEFQSMLGLHKSRDFDAVFSNWVLDNFQMAAAPNALFHSRFAQAEGSANRSGVADRQLDQLIERAGAATDRGEARVIWSQFYQRLQELQPLTFMFWLEELAASRDAVSGVDMDQRGELASMKDWRLQ